MLEMENLDRLVARFDRRNESCYHPGDIEHLRLVQLAF